ncbi:hypothetical protein [Helicovermis profundi]|uniref:Uncharacterized protein n=1 Tax=Helicovermis profundi TaxID=3065157 RepID=A0AAU9E788_9FIRM|nr:hypothetical protein HLPR_23010 [Clostridia bacterium S502]
MKFIKSLFKFVFGTILLIVVLVGVAFYFISSPKKTIDITWTKDDFNTYVNKGGITFDDSHASVEDIFANNLLTEGITNVNATFTNEEASAIANMSSNGNSIIKNVKIHCLGNDELEASAVIGDITPLINKFPALKKYESALKLIENKPIYAHSTLFFNKSTGLFDGVTKELYIGKVKIPTDKANDNLKYGGSAINKALKQLKGFSVKKFKVTSEGFKFDGTIPKKIESAGSLLN